MTENNQGQLVVISGPSGVGKSTICAELVNKLPNAYLSVSATTRPKAPNEVNHREYEFLTKEDFEKRIEQDDFLEYAEVFGNLYGTPKAKTEKAIEEGKIVILEIDVQGGRQVKEKYPQARMIFIVPPKPKDLESRINGRGRETIEQIEARLATASNEVASGWQYYKHMVINDDLETAVKEVIEIIKKPVGD